MKFIVIAILTLSHGHTQELKVAEYGGMNVCQAVTEKWTMIYNLRGRKLKHGTHLSFECRRSTDWWT
jgi:hypothetical protein